MPAASLRLFAAAFLLATAGPASAEAGTAPDLVGRTETLPAQPGKHWLWVYDMVYDYMADGRASLVDGDSGQFLGMLGTGYSFTQLTLPRKYDALYSAETHYSRTTRGERTDVVTIYDPRTLSPVDEIGIPAKRASTIPTLHNAVLTDDDRFMLVFNLTPATSVSVVDAKARRFAGEIETPGCSLLYPVGPRRFFMLCMDGGLLVVTLDEQGHAAEKARTERFFDPNVDPVSEKAVRFGDTWLFASFDGFLHEVDFSRGSPRFRDKWSLLDAPARADDWRVGGTQHLAVHEGQARLYSIVHQGGGPHSRKDPGRQVWVYDLHTRERVQVLELGAPAGLIAVTQDDAPLLFAADVAVNEIRVHDARTGEHLRTIGQVGYTPTGLQVPWRPTDAGSGKP